MWTQVSSASSNYCIPLADIFAPESLVGCCSLFLHVFKSCFPVTFSTFYEQIDRAFNKLRGNKENKKNLLSRNF